MASGHERRAERPNTWPHRPSQPRSAGHASNRLDVRGRLAAPCCRSCRPGQTTRELRVIGLGYVKWSAEQPDISAAKPRIQIVDREMPEPDTGHVGAILEGQQMLFKNVNI